MLVEIDEIAIKRELAIRVRAGDPLALAELKSEIRKWSLVGTGLYLYMHVLSVPVDSLLMSLRELEALGVVWGVRLEVDPR